jgi:CPA1 family monovalent cation:H+ antiporter
MVAIGLLIGNEGRAFAMSARTRHRLDVFWHLIDGILNGVLFVLIGLEFGLIEFPPGSAAAILLVVVLCLLARYVAVGLPTWAAHRWFGLPPSFGLLLTWSGVRGGISVALAFSMPPGADRNLILMLTYTVVVFSILVQGLTVARLARVLGSVSKVLRKRALARTPPPTRPSRANQELLTARLHEYRVGCRCRVAACCRSASTRGCRAAAAARGPVQGPGS